MERIPGSQIRSGFTQKPVHISGAHIQDANALKNWQPF
jgi:hypothetical protein